jgi:hypothetical protein
MDQASWVSIIAVLAGTGLGGAITLAQRVQRYQAENLFRLQQGAYSLIVAVFSEEKQPGYRRQHALELIDRAAVAASFPAEHAPCLDFRHGVLNGGADLTEARVELLLPVFQFLAASFLNGTMPMPSTPM